MKRFTILLVITLLMFGSITFVGAQDSTPAAEDIPAATVEAGDTSVTVSDGGQITTVTLPASDAEDNSGIGNVERAMYWGIIALLLAVIAIVVIRYSAAVRDLISPQTARAIYNDALIFSNKLTAAIPGEIDDSFKTIVAGMVDEQLKKWEVEQTQVTNKAVANALETMSNPG